MLLSIDPAKPKSLFTDLDYSIHVCHLNQQIVIGFLYHLPSRTLPGGTPKSVFIQPLVENKLRIHVETDAYIQKCSLCQQ